MGEIIAAAAIFLFLLFIALGRALVHWTLLVQAGALVAAAGLCAGSVVAVGYHLSLYRALSPLGVLPPRWWWHPTRYNREVPQKERRKVMPWFYAGMVSVFLDAVGCGLIFTGILIM